MNCYIIALGGQGSLLSNQEWNNKGEILVGAKDNVANLLSVGSNGTVLTADSSTNSGVSFKELPPGVPPGSIFLLGQAQHQIFLMVINYVMVLLQNHST